MDYMERYKEWLESDTFDQETKKELLAIKNNDSEIRDRFHMDLEFGTAGLRGKLGAGTNRMNEYTVALATEGLARTIVDEGREAMERGVVMAYDVRHKSKKFAEIGARVLAAHGIKVYLFDDIRSTPMLAYAVRELGSISGIVVTASHNPKDYNGYKIYWEEGSQILDDIANRILEAIEETGKFENIEYADLDEALSNDMIEYLGEEIDEKYYQKRLDEAINDDIDKDIRVVYTPLNGTGNEPVRKILEKRGFTNIMVVPEQEKPDPNFTTVGYPNPEDPQAFKYALELGKKQEADLLLATDPDADRVSIVVRDRSGEYIYFNGNQIAALYVYYIMSSRDKNGTLPENAAIVKSIVTGDLGKVIAKKYGVETYESLTGFKNICSKANEWDETGEHEFIFGYEESIGYTYGDLVRDKDAIISSMIMVEMAAYYKQRGKTLVDVLEEIYKEFGYYLEDLFSIELEGLEGSKRIERIMEDFRNEPIEKIGSIKLEKTIDYQEDKTGLPKSNVLKYYYDEGSWYGIRPSGTEPKLKIYIYANDKSKEKAEEKIEKIKTSIMEKLDKVK